jgi:GntR family transcriptional regulator, transcriptional repressor for pyruvate dehydrogenase complex
VEHKSTGQTKIADPLTSVSPQRLYSQVVRQLLGLIASGHLTAGDRLPPERELTQRLGVSRASVRQALTALEVMGVIQIRAGSGVYVGPPAEPGIEESLTSAASPLEILEARLIVEPGIARLAAARRGSADLARLEREVEAMAAELEAGRDGWEPDWGFHRSLADAAGNPSLAQLAQDLVEQMGQPMWLLMRSRNIARRHHGHRYLEHHRRILEAVAGGDAATAERCMRTHIRAVMVDLGERTPRRVGGPGD